MNSHSVNRNINSTVYMEVTEKIALKHVNKTFWSERGPVKVIEDLSFSVKKGEFVAILGASGCGKSTLLNLIAGLDSATSGEIFVNENDTKQPERHRMMLFQESALFPWYSVIENVMYGLHFKHGLDKSAYYEVALYYLSLVGLKNHAHSRIYQLSGGMKQRVALARALAPNPEILLMDEPFSALDALTCEQLYRYVQSIWESQQKTVILVTHNVREAVVLAQRVLILTPRSGKLLKEIKVDLPHKRTIYDPEVLKKADEIFSILHNETNYEFS